jgi:carbonic anhydrase
MSQSNIVSGALSFRRRFFARHSKTYAETVKFGQRPETLFITCSDSRILPDRVVNAKPGEMFVYRNIGNMIPPYSATNADPATTSIIEYALGFLGVRDIIVCGHSHCGAVQCLQDGILQEGMDYTLRWLEQGARAAKIVKSAATASTTREELLTATERALVVQHLENLKTYPLVNELLAAGDLQLQGWHYFIESGQIEHYDSRAMLFVPLRDMYSASRPSIEPFDLQGTKALLSSPAS